MVTVQENQDDGWYGRIEIHVTFSTHYACGSSPSQEGPPGGADPRRGSQQGPFCDDISHHNAHSGNVCLINPMVECAKLTEVKHRLFVHAS